MGTIKDTPGDFELRQRAEKELEIASGSTGAFSDMSPEKMASLIHELQVYQTELKMQNDELRSTRDELEKSRDRYVELYDFAPIGYFSVNQKGFVDEANLTIASMLGVARSALIGQPFTCFVLKDDQDVFYKHRQKLLKTDAPQSCELRLVKKNGHAFYARLECTIITSKADLKQIRTAASDITEHKQMESQLRRAQKMEAISTLAGGIAHDFNNILMAIIGYGQLAQMKLDPESEAYADLKEVLQSGTRAKLLIQQILAVGRGQEQERHPMQFKFIVKEALKFLRSTLPSTIEIRETYDKDIGVIDADPTQMHQVLMNLCTNAGHAMEQNGGILAVSLRNVDFGFRIAAGENVEPNLQAGCYLELTVSDTGYGMTPEIREKIFDSYFTTKEKGEGTGIGLSVVHGIVTQYGGAITVESEPGKGSTFHVYLPLTQGAEELQAVKDETPLPKGDERILFVDDEAVLARVGKKLLEALGYHVTATTSGIEALALFKDQPNQFDLVMTDTNMPNMPGDILARELMTIRPDIPVIIFTGLSKRMSKEKAKEVGIKAFIMKPLSMKVMGETVRRVLDSVMRSPPNPL